MTKSSQGRFSIRIELPALILLSLGLHAWAGAGDNLFTKYFHHQKRESVVVGPTRVPAVRADGKVHLSEREAIEMALRQNLDINVARHNSVFSLWGVEALRGIYDPSFTFDLTWDRQKIPTGSVLAGGNSVTNVATAYNFDYTQSFSTGTAVEGSFTGTRNRSTNFFSSLVPSIDTNFRMTLRQSLLKGFGRVAADYQIEIARNNRDVSDQDFKQKVVEVVAQVQGQYWELQFALEDIKVKEKSLQLAQTTLEHNRARLEVGTAARLTVIEAEAEVASRREELIRAQYNSRQVQDQLVQLITSFQDPREFPAEIIPSDAVFSPAPVTEPIDQLVRLAEELRPEVEKADLEVVNQSVNLKLARDQLRPTLDLSLSYQQFGLGGVQVIRDFSQGFVNPQIVDVIPGGVGDSLSQLFGGDFHGYSLGVRLNLPIFNTEARAESAQAQIALDQSQLRKRALKQVVTLEIRTALTRIEMNRARLEASQAAVRAASQRLEGEQARFQVGLGTTRELIEAQRDLVQAQSLLLRGQVDLIKSHVELDKAVGRTLESHHISLRDALRMNVK
ncbi:MAG: TolC family protein [Acidobacteriota bacterium]